MPTFDMYFIAKGRLISTFYSITNVCNRNLISPVAFAVVSFVV
ncbi:hypothetical protein PMI1130 [Proteus mirabilis HI4320]|uniref:Uncharacterized protein n=1 Tax=Proteus mirabilis (strain HI4320) TaxID=529507 RepID=B4EVS4_PROMH|nr:hypothetical protein PMI1130 [Proteus mirabilis HI4320]